VPQTSERPARDLRTVKEPRDSKPCSVSMEGEKPMLGRRAITAEAPLKSGGPGTAATMVAGTFSRIAPSGLAAVSCAHTHILNWNKALPIIHMRPGRRRYPASAYASSKLQRARALRTRHPFLPPTLCVRRTDLPRNAHTHTFYHGFWIGSPFASDLLRTKNRFSELH